MKELKEKTKKELIRRINSNISTYGSTKPHLGHDGINQVMDYIEKNYIPLAESVRIRAEALEGKVFSEVTINEKVSVPQEIVDQIKKEAAKGFRDMLLSIYVGKYMTARSINRVLGSYLKQLEASK